MSKDELVLNFQDLLIEFINNIYLFVVHLTALSVAHTTGTEWYDY
jgi:hypothetical protein